MLQEPDVLIWSSIQDATRIRKLPFEMISGVWLNIVSSFSHSKAHIAKNSLSTVGSRNNLVECITFRIVRQKLPLLHALYTERLWNYRCCLLNCYLGEWENSTFSCSVTSGNFWGCILGKVVSPPYHRNLGSCTIHNWGKNQKKSIFLFSYKRLPGVLWLIKYL